MAPKRKVERLAETWKSFDGTNIRLYSATVRNPLANVVLVHGFADHSGRYEHVVDAFCQAGFNMFRIDLRGHGKSDGARGFINSFDEYLKDINGAKGHWQEHTSNDKPWAIIGHSMGGLVVARYVETYPEDFVAAVLSSPFMGLRLPVPAWKNVMAKLAARFLPTLSLPAGIDPQMLTHDKDVLEAYTEDPLVFTSANARWFVEILSAQQSAFEQADRIKIPMLIMQAADDMLVDPEASRKFYEKITHPEKEFRIYDHCYHELFQELNKKKIIKDVLDWLKQNI